MMLIFGILGLAAGCFGLWFAIQKRLRLTEAELRESFKSLSFDAMERNSKVFLDLAKTSLEKYQEGAKLELEGRQKAIEASLLPIKESLKQIDEHQRELEKKRVGAYSALSTQLEGMALAEKELRQEMVRLVQSLRSPQMRGSWGQVHLRRVIELAGMINHCDF